MRLQGFIRRHVTVMALTTAAIAALALAACEEEQAPGPAPSSLSIVSGDAQYSKKGTELEAPIVVKVVLADGKPGAGEAVQFHVVEGGGTLSRATASANGSGLATVRWTLGPDTSPQRMRATVVSNSTLSVQLVATSSEYYCPEEDPAFVRKFTPQQNIFLFTRQSVLNRSGGANRVGLVRISPEYPTAFSGVSFVAFDEGALLNVVRDCAFSANGDFYVAWTHDSAAHEVMKIAPDGSTSHFATLESSFGSEITLLPGGVLAGCDEFGPFTVGCRDTLTRYEDAMYSGLDRDAANHDAVAADPASGDLYFIYRNNRRLMRLPLDGYTQTGPLEEVVTLEIDEADFARGMVVDDNDGSVFILVDNDADIKQIVKVTSAGVKSTVVDFFVERGAGDLAGFQSDLAIDQGIRQLFTLDTLNNVIVVYQIAGDALGTLASSGDAGAASDGSQGERVGLAVLP